MHFKRRYKICTCWVILGELNSFRNYRGLQYYFLENFTCKLSFYESENFSDSFLHHIFEFENVWLSDNFRKLNMHEWNAVFRKF